MILEDNRLISFLQQHPQISATPVVITELQKGIDALSHAVNSFSQRSYNKRSRRASAPHHDNTRKSVDALTEIVEARKKVAHLMEERVYGANPNELESIERLVSHPSNPYSNDGFNDERIVASAMYRAFDKGEHVCILTRDRRFSKIIARTQNLMHQCQELNALRDFLIEGNLSVLIGVGFNYKIDYCSQDFNNQSLGVAS